ncbi:uncharacterized protein EHS24_007447 [Apiotrichum porosum]|uniref:Uncharacterized protein n=1 Tax=Apiotrichum porosum TaxID=105984 RepID=A0A427XUF2_9TREE|nr:uncharacterized protein EHS24_007447 [Apiotrichum porosum]RSH82469.1 hypothetical protein EHS24_007447 [Apiotrichum porosum]
MESRIVRAVNEYDFSRSSASRKGFMQWWYTKYPDQSIEQWLQANDHVLEAFCPSYAIYKSPAGRTVRPQVPIDLSNSEDEEELREISGGEER